ncbi:putative YEATS domain-containing protein 2 [Apostichopus japonicus]|uniref:Putative YEATS domain-containing protein 2 n=1 Tax=Stichopus japonicus TaxID=307972 RepID=A0A2G8JZ95_STIJA|nr:putative YEATS domain-containing protein 2 [Apostichopus japonicus]
MASKRSSSYLGSDGSDQDPDYAMVTSSHPVKKQKLHQQDAKDTTVKKIENIIKKHFSLEIRNKEKEIDLADERIHQVRMMLDKLRACVVANFYGNAGRCPGSEKSKHKLDLNHPAVQRALGTNLESTIGSRASPDSLQAQDQQNGLVSELEVQRKDDELPPYTGEVVLYLLTHCADCSLKIHGLQIVYKIPPAIQIKAGEEDLSCFQPLAKHLISFKEEDNRRKCAKYITTENREDSDPSTHKWMVYVRGPTEEPRIDHFVKKVWFYLHPSYRPNDLVEVKDPPFHLTRRGWGEFPIRVQLHFNDPRSKKVDIIHHLKLDRTYTGLQTLGAETIVDVELDRYLFDEEEATLSRPSTPTVTKVNYREGFKAGLSRTPPSLRSSPSIFSTKSSSPQTSDDQRSTPASSPISEMSRGSSRRGTPVTLEDSFGIASRSSNPITKLDE